MPRLYFQLAFAIIIALAIIMISPISLQTYSAIFLSQSPPPPPQTPPPPPPRDNQPRTGTGLDPTNPNCKKTSKSITALVPIKNPVFTTSEYPTFLFYIPYNPEDINSVEFSLQTADGKKRIYKAAVTLPKTPGIISVSLQKSPNYALELNKYYLWYFKLNCEPYTRSTTDLSVNGFVARVPLTSERQQQINTATPDIWYDSVASLAQRLLANPQDEKLKIQWIKLLESAGYRALAEEPLVGAVQLLEK
ncbi:DUF928 domain-containing protein [Microcoleus sp. Pol14D6]|uniref:DUF928 domain-containing protein n=1 Tax=unclassified Microcoleus TaxID=2642155 RepID=UPI002FD08121